MTAIELPVTDHALCSDDDLMARIEAGDVEQSLAALQQRYGERVRNLVQSIVRDAHLAEDVAQEVFAKVFLKSQLYRRGTNFQAWLFEVARNQALSALRARRNAPRPVGTMAIGLDDEAPAPWEPLAARSEFDTLEERELMAAFDAAVGALPARYRAVFELCVLRGWQYRDAAQWLGIPTGTVAIRIMRARQRLFAALGHHIGRLRRPPACLQQ